MAANCPVSSCQRVRRRRAVRDRPAVARRARQHNAKRPGVVLQQRRAGPPPTSPARSARSCRRWRSSCRLCRLPDSRVLRLPRLALLLVPERSTRDTPSSWARRCCSSARPRCSRSRSARSKARSRTSRGRAASARRSPIVMLGYLNGTGAAILLLTLLAFSVDSRHAVLVRRRPSAACAERLRDAAAPARHASARGATNASAIESGSRSSRST